MPHKFSIRFPHSIEEALNIDEQTGTNFWWQAINKEMQHMRIVKDVFTPKQVRKSQVPKLRSFQRLVAIAFLISRWILLISADL